MPFLQTSNSNDYLKRKVLIFSLIPATFFLILIILLFTLQIVRGPDYEKRAKSNREQYAILPAIRGKIYDKTGNTVFATNKRSFVITIVPQNLPADINQRKKLLKKVAKLLNITEKDILKIISQRKFSKYGSYVIKSDVPFEVVAFLAEHNRDFPGVYWKSKPIRVYPHRDLLSHVLGYVGLISERELIEKEGKGYNLESVVGKSGVEKMYDGRLKGKDGIIRRIVDASNQVTAEIIDKGKEPIPGDNIYLTIDGNIQRLTEQALGDNIGAVIVSRPATGEILAMASYPRFDPNLFVGQKNKTEFKKLLLDKRKPFLNRAIQAQYPAGSIFKLVDSIAILDTQKVKPDKTFICGGGYKLGNRFFSCWSNHGIVDLYRAIVFSCDSYFYQTSLILGPEVIADYARKLGFGRKLGIDLSGEMIGVVPDPEWKKKVLGDIWYDGDTLNLSIGQGYLLVTPLQINALTNIIVNDGVLMIPHVVDRIVSARDERVIFKSRPKILIDTGLDPKIFEWIKSAMRTVVTDGTARWGGAVYSCAMAGKTSSAEVVGRETHSWFTAFAPYGSKDKKNIISVTAIVEHGGAGSETAAPIVSEIIEAIFSHSDLKTAKRNIWKKRAELAKEKKKRPQDIDRVFTE